MRNIATAAIVTALTLAACGKQEGPPPPPPRTDLVGLPLDAKDQNAKVARRLSVQGNWKGPKDAGNRGRYLSLDVAGTSEYTLDLKGVEGGKEAIYASGRGKLTWDAKDILVGKGDADKGLEDYRQWSAGFPAQNVMTIRAGGKDVELRRS